MIEWENHDIIIELPPEGRDGASVTPRGVWDENEHYYYLDIVTYRGGSYLAITDVPAGTLPTNTTYWQTVSTNTHWGEITGDLEDQTDLKAVLDAKADADDVYTKSQVYTKTEADDLLDLKANKADVYTQEELDGIFDAIDNALDTKADKSSTYTKTEVNTALSAKSDKSSTYTKTETDALLNAKADKSTTYTKTQTDNLLAAKANSADVYSKSAVDSALAGKADKSDTYTKSQADTLLSAKANTADLGTMASVNDAPSDGKQYARKNGQWAEVEGGGGGSAEWGAITGTLSDQTDLQTALDNKAPVILNSASGSIASFSDGSASPVNALSVGIEPVQDLHGYDNPWPGGGGKNLFDTSTPSTIDCYSYSGTPTTSPQGFNLHLPDGTYTVSYQDTNFVTYVYGNVCNADDSWDSSFYITTSSVGNPTTKTLSNGQYFKIFKVTNTEGPAITNAKIQVELGSSATSYAPYSNICPISGHTQAVVTRTGKNLLKISQDNEVLKNGGTLFTLAYSDNNTVKMVTNTVASLSVVYHILDVTDNLVGQMLNLSIEGISNYANYRLLKTTNKVWGSGHTEITTYNNTKHVIQQSDVGQKIGFRFLNNTGADVTISKVQVEIGSTATTFEPYSGTQVTIDLGGTYYGGYIDVLTGQMTVNTRFLELKDVATEDLWTPYTNCSGYYLKTAELDVPMLSGSWFNDNRACCSHYKKNNSWTGQYGGLGVRFGNNNSNIFFCSVDTDYPTESSWMSYLSTAGITVTYPIEPFTVQLTPAQMQTLLGTNNIWTSTGGDTSVEYRADTKLFIEKLTQPTEDDMIANANIASGKYFMVGNSLYLSTASIATGDAIVPGTNCTALSLADALNNLNA